MNDRSKDYNIGLDIGTSSVGWAVTDDNYNLLQGKKKNLWGVRLFSTAQTAAERRVFRSTRRRYRRRKNRINWLNEIFSDELYKLDPSFLTRLNNSWISKKDSSRTRDRYNLFMDKNYTDVEYHQEYPTIFHLRKRLIEDKSKADLRLIYLAIHNILKYRGNFTYEHQKFDVSNMQDGLDITLTEFNSQLDSCGIPFLNPNNIEKISKTLLKKINPTQKIQETVDEISPKPENFELQIIKEILKMILGNKAKLNKIFSLDSEEKTTIEFSSKSIEGDLVNLESSLTDEQFNLINKANAIYSIITLNDILNGENYLSFAKARQYCDHKKDLKKLKTMWLETSDTKAVKENKKAYDKYINLGKYDIQEFYKDMSKFLKVATPKELADEAEKKISDKSYLLKQRNNENGVIPFQLNKNELEIIIDNQSQYYPFLKENKDKIISILSFRIPYYVGPLETEDSNNPFAWMVKKSNKAVRPWNFDEVVDREKSSNNFIRRMTSTDSYLIGEPVLPKMSLICQQYEVLNELNNIRISEDDEDESHATKLDIDTKQRIYNELFKKHRKMTEKILKKWLIQNSYYKNPTIIGLTDKKNFNSNLSTYLDFKNIFGEEFVEDKNNQSQLESLVEWLTIFEDKQILKLKLKNSTFNYTDNQIKKITNMRYQGWGRLSKKLLCDSKVETKTKKSHQSAFYSILDLMWNTNRNFISILKSDKYEFEDKIQDYNLDKNQDLTPKDMINDLQTSPALKRGIWQSIILVKEIVKFMHHAPKHIFLEFTRENDVSELTKSRYKRLNKLYNNVSNNAKKLDIDLRDTLVPDKNIKEYLKKNSSNLSSDRLMLYFLQMGKSLYSDQPLDITRLSDYQIDHILPQSYVKDDSLENRALVLASENQHKADNLLLKKEVIDNNIQRWRAMKEIGLMGPKKFKNLTRIQITENDQEHFINRQLVQTSQIIKNVSNILNSMYGDQGTSCIETRANMATDFRKAFSHEDKYYHFEHPEFVKNREVNDYHHAQDAYLSCLLGMYLMKKFPTDNMLLVQKEYKKFFNSAKKEFDKKHHIPDFVKNGFIIGTLFKGEEQIDTSTGEIIWNQDIKEKVSRIFQYKQFNITRRTEIATGAFYDQTIYPRKDGILIPLKKNLDPKLYGGFSGDKTAYMVLVKIDGKKNKLVKVPIRLAQQIDDQDLLLKDYIVKYAKHKKSIEILKTHIPIGQLIYNPQIGYLSLKSDTEITNAQQLVLPYQYVALLTLLQKTPEAKYVEILSNYNSNVLDEILEVIIDKMTKFYPFYPGELKCLSNNSDSFSESTIVQKVNTLQQLMIFLHANSSNANFEFKNVKKSRFGRKGNGLKNIENTDLIYQSPTGLYESRIHID